MLPNVVELRPNADLIEMQVKIAVHWTRALRKAPFQQTKMHQNNGEETKKIVSTTYFPTNQPGVDRGNNSLLDESKLHRSANVAVVVLNRLVICTRLAICVLLFVPFSIDSVWTGETHE